MERLTKEFILEAVRRCASGNGGVPLGRERFEAITKIRESAWLGRYWTRWSDVLRDAGFEPNAFQDRVHQEDGLIRHLAELTRALGHFPTNAELRMRRRADPEFPSPNVFPGRLGNRAAQISSIVNFTQANPDFADVHEIVLPLLRDEAESTDAADNSSRPGYVYLIRSGKHHKIGRTNHLGRRTYEIALQLPERLELVHVLETDDPAGIERYWHERFADRRLNGEWFLLSRADVAAFKRRRRFM